MCVLMFQLFSDSNSFQVANSILGYFYFVLRLKPSTLLYFQIEISNFLPEKMLICKRKKKYVAAVTRVIDNRGNAVQLNGFFGKTFYFYHLFSQSTTLPVYLFVSLFVIYIFYLTIFQP